MESNQRLSVDSTNRRSHVCLLLNNIELSDNVGVRQCRTVDVCALYCVLCTVASSVLSACRARERETGADNVASTFTVSCVGVEVRLQDEIDSK